MKSTNRYFVCIDRSKERDVMVIDCYQRRIVGIPLKDKKAIYRTVYQGPPRQFVQINGGVLCVKCGKMKNTMRGTQKHFKQVHI